jgi:hypothetical protein
LNAAAAAAAAIVSSSAVWQTKQAQYVFVTATPVPSVLS